MTRIGVDPFGVAKIACALACAALLFACTAKEERVEKDFNFDGSCINCHRGLSAGQVHPTFKLRCVDCHAGNDQVNVPEDAFEDEAVFRDPALLEASHVQVKNPALARFFFANGIDDDNDGIIDEEIEIDGTVDPPVVTDFGEIAQLGLQGEGVGAFLDTEYNRDLNYTRWVNPGDLRVATLSCGGGSRLAGETGSVCHQSVVDTVRRSIMVNQAAVINGAYYGNESWRDAFQIERDDVAVAADPRKGAFGYPMDYGLADDCIVQPSADDVGGEAGGRAQPRFDSACIEEAVLLANPDPNAQANVPGNLNLPAFESVQGAIVGSVDGTEEDSTLEIKGVFEGSGRFDGWGGKKVRDPSAILAELAPVLDENLVDTAIPDPVDNILRGFRAYYPLNYPGSTINQNFTFGESIQPNIQLLQNNNPFGRGHSAGCTACHMNYNYDGSRNPQNDVEEEDEDGNLVQVDNVVDPTTKHREFNPADQDIVSIDGVERVIGITVNAADRDVDGDGDIEIGVGNSPDREQQRMYSSDHELTTRITTQQCGLCHAFVTRINLAYQGMSEDEQRDALARIDIKQGVTFDRTIRFTTPKGTKVPSTTRSFARSSTTSEAICNSSASPAATTASSK